MPRRRFPVLTALLLAPAAAGCVSDGETAGGPLGFPWVVESPYPESRDDLKSASRLDLTYAQWQEHLGNIPEAEQSYQRVLRENPRSIDALLGLARLEQLAGRPEKAEQAFRRALEASPGSPQALAALGQFYAAEERWGEAVAMLGRAVEAAPEDTVYRHHYAVTLARSGDTARALVEFRKAVGEAEAHYNVGYILYEQGRHELAEREFLQAVALRPDLSAAQAMLDQLRRDETTSIAQNGIAGRPQVTQTAAVASPTANRQVAPASVTMPSRPVFHEAGATVHRRPAVPKPIITSPSTPMPAAAPTVSPAPAASSAPAPVPAPATEPAPTVAATGAAGPTPAQWQMPTRRDPAAIFAEQMRNQAPLPQ